MVNRNCCQSASHRDPDLECAPVARQDTARVDIAYCPGDNEIVNVLEFTADKLPNGSQCAVLFKFSADDLITEERWFVDTEQWKAAF